MFIAALFKIAKTWKQPQSSSTGEWIRKKWYIYTVEHYSAMKKNEVMQFAATRTQLEITILSKVSQTKTNKILIIYMWNLKNGANETLYKRETDPQILRTDL
uniref:Uncharacterized protein n=1 Tax=Sus scrofa TaxID=9823 RepID=A0A8D0JL41_PIG